MLNIEKGSFKHLLLEIVVLIIVGIILFPLFDYLYYTFITNSKFVYNIHDYIIDPILFGIIMGTILFEGNKISDKKKDKENNKK